jgi:hypothetical protein
MTGGWHASTENTNKIERYDVQSNTWEFKASMCERRYRPGMYYKNNRHKDTAFYDKLVVIG